MEVQENRRMIEQIRKEIKKKNNQMELFNS